MPILSVISNSTSGNSPTPNRIHDPRCAIQQSVFDDEDFAPALRKDLLLTYKQRRRLSQSWYESNATQLGGLGRGTALAELATEKIEEIQKEISI